MSWKQKVVIHDEFGGFSLTEQMIEMLKKRGCEWADRCGRASGRTPRYYLPYDDDDREQYRRDPDLIAVVEELTKKFDKKATPKDGEFLPWRERATLRRDTLANLKVVEVTVSIEIDDHDGKETVRVCGGAW